MSGVADVYSAILSRTARRIPEMELRRRAIVFSPHPDDEVLGCGGTILKKRAMGAAVHLVHMTDGGASSSLMPRSNLVALRKNEAMHAAGALGIQSVDFLDFPDGQLHHFTAEATDTVSGILRNEQPEEVFIPYRREPMRQAADHRTTTSIVLNALTRLKMRVTVREYPVWFWCNWPWLSFRQTKPPLKSRHVIKNSALAAFGLQAFFGLNYLVDISDFKQEKRAALDAHKSQMEHMIDDPHWVTLADLSNGEFLRCFYRDFEFFHSPAPRSRQS